MKYYDFLDNEEENVIKRFVEGETKNVLHGILVCNIDNFIIVNEMFGRSTGDQILKQIQEKMKRLFRGNDVIVKLRGDEFIVLNKNIATLSNVELLANKLLHALSDINVKDSFNLTVSVGLSIYPLHGSTYSELKNKAYQAMYRAKANGKNGFRLFDSARTKSVYHDYLFNKKPLDTDFDVLYAVDDNKTYQELCTDMFRENRDAFSALNSIMELSCIYLGFSRAYCYTTRELTAEDEKKLHYANSGFEFGNESAAMKAIKVDIISRLASKYDKIAMINKTDESLDDAVLMYMEDFNVSQMLFYPLYINDELVGAVILENLTEDFVVFDDSEIDSLYEQMQSIQAYFYRMIDKKNSSDLLTKLEMFENLDACVYIVDKETKTIEYTNRMAKELDGENRIGQKCYETFNNKDHACKSCPLNDMDNDDPKASDNNTLFNFAIGKWTRNLYSWMDVNEDNGKAIVIMVDIDDYFNDSRM